MIDYLLLGLTQGLTELLPVSSSGHLVLLGRLLGVESPGVFVEVVLHLGTLLAVVWAFRGELWDIAAGLGRPGSAGRRLLRDLVIATLPIVLGGLLLRDLVHEAFASPRVAAIGLLFTGTVLLGTQAAGEATRPWRPLCALAMGLAQVVALLPGVSRSGMTIAAGIGYGVNRATAARFSFLMSVPAILGATVVELLDLDRALLASQAWGPLAVGFVAAFLAGLVAIRLLFRLLDRRRFVWFAIYCLLAGTVALFVLH